MTIHTQEIKVQALNFTLTLDLPGDFPLDVDILSSPVTGEQRYDQVMIKVKSETGNDLLPGKLRLSWFVPAVDMHGLINFPPSASDMGMLPFWWGKKRTCASSSLPFFILYHRNGNNRFGFGLLDQLTETEFAFEMSEEKAGYIFSSAKPMVMKDGFYQETLFISRADIPWQSVVGDYRQFVDSQWPQARFPVPPAAYLPCFCTWTAIHHAVSQAWILENAQIAARLGFRTWITDDGWFTEKASFANYSYTGDWQPAEKKFPDFAGHVRQLQEMGFRYLLWVSPFMVGDDSTALRSYSGLLQEPIKQLHFSNLSPFKKQTGEIVSQLLERLMITYHLDGLKLDFLDSLDPGQVPEDRDYLTAGEGIYEIMSRVMDRLAQLNPEVLIELRNPYTNLASRRYGNLYRASDVPVNPALNRWQVSMERLLTPDRVVILDPALWHPDDSDENVAVTLINTICSVPMVSVDLTRYPQHHQDLVRYWMGFYTGHLNTIIHGEFIPEFHRNFLPLIRFNGEAERIIGLYEDEAVDIGAGVTPIWILNASTRPTIKLLPGHFEGQHNVITLNKFGRIMHKERVIFPTPQLDVEVGGSLNIL